MTTEGGGAGPDGRARLERAAETARRLIGRPHDAALASFVNLLAARPEFEAVAATGRASLLRAIHAHVVREGAKVDAAALAALCLALDADGAGQTGDFEADWLDWPEGPELVVEMAHDLRAPITAILFLSETLLRGRSGAVNQIQERQLGLIYSAAFALSTLANDLIEVGRRGEGLLDRSPMPFAIDEILASLRQIVSPMAEEKGIAVVLRAEVPDPRLGHSSAVTRVLLNLATNAIKFTEQGEVAVRAEAAEGDLVRFEVRDTGRGIPPEAMATLFVPFRGRSKSRRFGFSGAGLGLLICRKLIEKMGGTLEVETELNVGTAFRFALPLRRAAHGRESLAS